MMERPFIELSSIVFGAADAGALARFYSDLFGWDIVVDEGEWVMLRDPGTGRGLSVQHEPHHVEPVWPAGPGDQQMMIHLDVGTTDMDAAVRWATECGAHLADHQPQEGVRVMIDPEGHPFCLFPVTAPA